MQTGGFFHFGESTPYEIFFLNVPKISRKTFSNGNSVLVFLMLFRCLSHEAQAWLYLQEFKEPSHSFFFKKYFFKIFICFKNKFPLLFSKKIFGFGVLIWPSSLFLWPFCCTISCSSVMRIRHFGVAVDVWGIHSNTWMRLGSSFTFSILHSLFALVWDSNRIFSILFEWLQIRPDYVLMLLPYPVPMRIFLYRWVLRRNLVRGRSTGVSSGFISRGIAEYTPCNT